MRSLYSKVLFTLLVINLSCSSDDKAEEKSKNPNKRLESITFTNTENLLSNQNKLKYDTNNNLTETRDANNLLISKNVYDINGRLVSREFNEYDDGELFFKEIDKITYDSQNRIINIEHQSSFHSPANGIKENDTSNHRITYEGNKITKTFDGGSTTKVEYFTEGDQIKKVKLYNWDKLAGDFEFQYDSNGNCIKGSGPILIDSFEGQTNNIDLKAIYGAEKKIKEIRRPLLDYELLSLESFRSLRQIMTTQVGSNYPEEISWNQNHSKTTIRNDYELDSDGFIIQNSVSRVPDFPNHTLIEYTWR